LAAAASRSTSAPGDTCPTARRVQHVPHLRPPRLCTPISDCEIHHLDEWIVHELTDLKRLIPLCKHHRHSLRS